ncbi:MAG TPA: hypothetical protein VD965_04690 [Burkholderiales bacterium]|nr:hypothetical protein [Burkholderiales bacterium]
MAIRDTNHNNVADDSVYSSTLRHARDLLGGDQQLAKHLRVPLADLQRWLSGEEPPPRQVFLRAVDLVLEGKAKP